MAAAFGVVRFPGPGPGFGIALLKLAVTTIIFGVVFLGEETGWRGYLLFRLAELTSGRRAALLTGAFHAIRHLPLLLHHHLPECGEPLDRGTDGDGHPPWPVPGTAGFDCGREASGRSASPTVPSTT